MTDEFARGEVAGMLLALALVLFGGLIVFVIMATRRYVPPPPPRWHGNPDTEPDPPVDEWREDLEGRSGRSDRSSRPLSRRVDPGPFRRGSGHWGA